MATASTFPPEKNHTGASGELLGLDNEREEAGHEQTQMFTNLAILEGKLAVAGSRISVELILNSLAYDWSVGDVVEICPKIKPEAALAFATDVRRRKLFDTVAEIEVSVGEGRT